MKAFWHKMTQLKAWIISLRKRNSIFLRDWNSNFQYMYIPKDYTEALLSVLKKQLPALIIASLNEDWCCYFLLFILGCLWAHRDPKLFICADYETSPMDLNRGWRPRGPIFHEWIKSFLLNAKKRPRWAQRCGPQCAPAACLGPWHRLGPLWHYTDGSNAK